MKKATKGNIYGFMSYVTLALVSSVAAFAGVKIKAHLVDKKLAKSVEAQKITN